MGLKKHVQRGEVQGASRRRGHSGLLPPVSTSVSASSLNVKKQDDLCYRESGHNMADNRDDNFSKDYASSARAAAAAADDERSSSVVSSDAAAAERGGAVRERHLDRLEHDEDSNNVEEDDDESDESPSATLARLADAARHRIVVLRAWGAGHSGSRHFDGQSPGAQLCLVADLLRHELVEEQSSFWVDCAKHALVKSLYPLIEAEIGLEEQEATQEWRRACQVLFASSLNGGLVSGDRRRRRPPDGLPPLHSTDLDSWRGAVDFTVAQLLPDTALRRLLSGAVNDGDALRVLADIARPNAYSADVALSDDGDDLGGESRLRRRSSLQEDDCKRANALLASLNSDRCGESDFFQPVHYEDHEDVVAQLREALDCLLEAESTAGEARRAASALMAKASSPRQWRAAKSAFAQAEELWQEQCRTLSSTLGILLRAIAHHPDHGWVHVLNNSSSSKDLATKVRAFDSAAPLLLESRATDDLYAELVDLQDYIASCHSLCLPSRVLWDALRTRPPPPREDDQGAAASAAAK